MSPYRLNVSTNLDFKSVAVIIATHKMFPQLDSCLQSFRQLLPEPHDLVLVDNGSEENIKKWADTRLSGITVIRLPENRLFCGGYNAGIKVAIERGYEFVLMVNADTEVANPLFLKGLLATAYRWPKAAFIGPLVYYRSRGLIQKTCLQYPKILRNISIWLPWRLARKYFQQQPRNETVVEFLNGICVLCRVSALREIGLMDERLGGYVEDADWAWRAREKGWVSVFTPVPSVIHHEEVFGYNHYSMKSFLLKRNTVLWFLKTRKRRSAIAYAAAAIVLAQIRMMFELSKESKKEHKYFLKRLQRVYKGLFKGEEMGEWFGPPLGNWENKL